MLHQIGGDCVKHRTEDEVLPTSRTRGVDDTESHVAFTRVHGWTHVIDLFDAANGTRHRRRFTDVADHDIVNTQRAQSCCRRVGLDAGANLLARC